MSTGTQRVPFEGPKEYNIMLVGEAPGAEEVGQGRPFVGKSGQLLERYLERNMITRSQVKLANLCKYRPGTHHNEFKALLGTSELAEGLKELQDEIESAKPNVIIALGNWPMYYLTGLSGMRNGKNMELRWAERMLGQWHLWLEISPQEIRRCQTMSFMRLSPCLYRSPTRLGTEPSVQSRYQTRDRG